MQAEDARARAGAGSAGGSGHEIPQSRHKSDEERPPRLPAPLGPWVAVYKRVAPEASFAIKWKLRCPPQQIRASSGERYGRSEAVSIAARRHHAMPKLQRFRGVRQRHWGSWVSEIRHPLLKTRIWLGTYETAEDAARAYDEAARLMSGPAARTNFPPNSAGGGGGTLSPTLRAKLEKCCTAPLEPGPAQGQRHGASAPRTTAQGQGGHEEEDDEEAAAKDGEEDEEDIEAMIRELTYYGPVEIQQNQHPSSAGAACSSSAITSATVTTRH
ncbi:hypothetical protein U9M48_034132 [Paspalum notatum var. saurae]|uniref:AP2/ERF domain-containing protein n=1 Tax=Paspalum notatum var. saurae TaxID=547442 RepID=A0AAQ3UA48_PASNO